jgi:hypothetical protein
LVDVTLLWNCMKTVSSNRWLKQRVDFCDGRQT